MHVACILVLLTHSFDEYKISGGVSIVEAAKGGSAAELYMIVPLFILVWCKQGKEREIRTQAAANASGVPFKVTIVNDYLPLKHLIDH